MTTGYDELISIIDDMIDNGSQLTDKQRKTIDYWRNHEKRIIHTFDDGEKMIYKDKAIEYLSQAGVLWFEEGIEYGKDDGIEVRMNASNAFAWGQLYYIPLNDVDDLEKLLHMHFADTKWGSWKWACIKENMRPQIPVMRDMIADGAWDDEMDALPANHYDRMCWELLGCKTHMPSDIELPKRIQGTIDNVPSDAIWVGKGSKWGNPFFDDLSVKSDIATHNQAVSKYTIALSKDELPFKRADVKSELKGKMLICDCDCDGNDKRCYADSLMRVAN